MRGKQNSRTNNGNKANQAVYECTACESKIKTTFEANLHPLLGCLVCRECKSTYGNGNFAKNFEDGVDEAGDDNYCRWCCDGGKLFGCVKGFGDGEEESEVDRCHYSFCKECIERNVPDDPILKIDQMSEEETEKMKWFCYACDKTKLAKLRQAAQVAMTDLNEREKKKRDTSNEDAPTNQIKKRKTDNGSRSSLNLRAHAGAAPPGNLNLAETIFAPPGLIPRPKLQSNQDETKKQDSDKLATKEPQSLSPQAKEPQTQNVQTKELQINASQVKESQTKVLAPQDKDTSQPRDSQNKGVAQTKETPANESVQLKEVPSAKDVLPNKTQTIKETPVKVAPVKDAQPPTKEMSTTKDVSMIKATPSKEAPIKVMSAKDAAAKATPNKEALKVVSTRDSEVRAIPPRESLQVKQTPLAAAKALTANLIAPVRPRPMSTHISIVPKNQAIGKQALPTKPRESIPKFSERQEPINQIKKPGNGKPLNEFELKKRLDNYNKTKDTCLEEVGSKFTNIVQMFSSKDLVKNGSRAEHLINLEIDSLQKTMLEFELMLRDLKRLSHSL